MNSNRPDGKRWIENEQYRHVYNKLWLCSTQDVRFAPCGVEPEKYPVFYKPIMNLYSLGAFAFKANEAIQSSKKHPGIFWMEYLSGDHFTVDGNWNGSSIRNPAIYKANKKNDVFESWIPVDTALEVPERWGRSYLADYEGPINFEWIGETLIEVHLRKSLQIQLAIGGDRFDPSYSDVVIPIFKNSKSYEIEEWERIKLEHQNPETRIELTRSNHAHRSTNDKWRVGYILASDLDTGRLVREKIRSKVIS